MDTRKHKFRDFLISLSVLAGVGYGLYWVAAQVFAQLASVTSDLGKAIVAAGATVVVATISLVFGKIWEQRVKLQEEVRQKKLPVYQQHIEFIFKTLFGPKAGDLGSTEEEIIAAFRAFTAQIVVWGGPEVIKAWTSFRLHSWEGTEPVQGFLKFEAFIRAVRAELGNRNTALTDGDLLKLFINDFDTSKSTPSNQ